MATPDFILQLRSHVGTSPLWLTGVTAVVTRGEQVLVVRRADTGAWTPVTGIIDPGEEPAQAAVREVWEEAGIRAVPERIALVHVTRPVTYPNGDRAQYIDIVFRLAWQSGEPHPADGENTAARWAHWDELPRLSPDMLRRFEAARAPSGPAAFNA